MDLARAERSSWLYDQRVRRLAYQVLLLAVIAAVAWGGIENAVTNMRARGIPMGFGFWNDVAGFDINLHLISYSNLSTYGRAFRVGLLNTLLIAVICIPLATVLGFAIGVARLSPNWLFSRFALVLLLLFWYNAVLKSLPGPRHFISVGDFVFLNNRGLYLPMPLARNSAVWFLGTVGASFALAIGVRVWARRRQDWTGAQTPTALIAAALILGPLAIVVAVAGAPFAFDVARLSDLSPSPRRSLRRPVAPAFRRCRLVRVRRWGRLACIAACR
jgi:general L-amino acid transport system permease protein